jgi:hypothetical protein
VTIQLDVVFYDVTTFYFESNVEREDSLRQIGFSKDGKLGNTRILFGLLIDKHKQPIGYRIYKGNYNVYKTTPVIFAGVFYYLMLRTVLKFCRILVALCFRGVFSVNFATKTQRH